jgi:hypothetical protein
MREQEAELVLTRFAHIFSLKAEYLRRDAANMRAGLLSTNMCEEDRVKYTKADRLFEEAEQWDAMAVRALEGYLLVFPDNQEFQRERHYRPLTDLCCAAGRCVSVEPRREPCLADQGLRQLSRVT